MRITFYQLLKHFSVKLFMLRHLETNPSQLSNKPAELALEIINFSHKHKSHLWKEKTLIY